MYLSEGNLIHKVFITKEAEFDYLFTAKKELDNKELKLELEEYLNNFSKVKNLKQTIIARYDNLLLFIERSYRLGIIQTWKLIGVCKFSDYDEELEELGLIRLWLRSILLED